MTFNKCSINGRQFGYVYDENGREIEISEVEFGFGKHNLSLF